MAYFLIVGLAGLYLVLSVAAWLYQRHQAHKGRPPIGDDPGIEELLACQAEVEALFRDVGGKYHEIPQHLTKAPIDVKRRIREVQGDWRRRWQEVGRYCRFVERSGRKMPPGFDRLATVYMDLEELDIGHAALLGRFARQMAPRVDEMRRALQESRQTLEAARGTSGKPSSPAVLPAENAQDAGAPPPAAH